MDTYVDVLMMGLLICLVNKGSVGLLKVHEEDLVFGREFGRIFIVEKTKGSGIYFIKRQLKVFLL